MDDKVLEAFSFAAVQAYPQIKEKLEENDVNHEEFLEWLKEKCSRVVSEKKPDVPPPPRKRLMRKCPKCGEWLHLVQVNNCPGCMVGGDWNSQWKCLKCEWEEFSEKMPEEEAKPYIIEV